jgi:hypothetical protein
MIMGLFQFISSMMKAFASDRIKNNYVVLIIIIPEDITNVIIDKKRNSFVLEFK